MINLLNMILNIHKFEKHKWKKKVPKKYYNLGKWKYITTFKYCYPNIPEILIQQYGLKWNDKIIVYITKQITLPHFKNYRTKFKKVFCGQLKKWDTHIVKFMNSINIANK